MPDCGLLERCLFYNDKQTARTAVTHYLKMRYCKGGGSFACARFIVVKKLGEETLPQDLLPDQLNKMRDILGFL